ncbi:Bug family tripartite tricarboxylate transporter substrate binding protein [Leptothrix discophora]|uniref:Tripartite tricarboxylate transporter substrate binding protein n=1 Tax=Leptothrix discophora TaxID=89 RepID=A0ABT9G845_LEPDI|nr:tripartite tricarboxylate transporter substrate binding protein [Leptothrix discophora]MDP4302664.1 tripartite tricarboxylate transporter substrate binding protein [Leptothrix discophora]
MKPLLIPSIAAALCAAALAGPARAEDFPSRPIRILVGFAPGGNVDTPTRIVARRLAEVLGVAVVVENKPGAGGNIAAESVARSPADGHTLLACGATSHGANSALFSKLTYDPVKDFAPVTMFGTVPNVLVVNPAVPATTFAEFAAWVKVEPSRANIASAGIGTSQHLSIELLKSMTGLATTHVPYKGGAPAMSDVLAGQVPSMVAGMPTALPAIKAGKVRAIAVTSTKRSPNLPQVPTLAEAGVAGYDVTNWVGLCAPAGVSPQTLTKLYTAVQTALASTEISKSLVDIGYEPAAVTPLELSAFIQREVPKWLKVVREAGITPE